MKSKHKQEHSSLSVMDAIETLSTIADLDLEEFTEEMQSIQAEGGEDSKQTAFTKRVQWVQESLKGNGNGRIKEIYGVILNYLRNFYKKEHGYLTDPQALEGIKGIMVVVSDSAKKLDHFASYFKRNHRTSVTQLKEYKQLNEFYYKRIAKEVDEGMLGKWILALSQRTMERQNELLKKDFDLNATEIEEAPRHLFVNLETVKKDTEYELFFIRKEDGSHYFSPRLLRNMKLICDFSGIELHKDPLIDIQLWQDIQMHDIAKDILHDTHEVIDRFYHEAFKYRHRDLVINLHKCIMALFLCGNTKNMLQAVPSSTEENKKGCYGYFLDFLYFLRETLHSNDYQKLLIYPQEKRKEVEGLLLTVLHGLCRAVFFGLHRFHDFDSHLKDLMAKSQTDKAEGQTLGNLDSERNAITEKNQLQTMIENDYYALSKLFKNHSRGPLNKLLSAIFGGEYNAFDPFTQVNVPSCLYAIAIGGHKIVNIHLPSPTHQEYIHRANVLDEFKGALRSCSSDFPPYRHLIINLQDRTSWKEHSRAVALEDLRVYEGLDKALVVATLARDTEFYHQLANYQQENHANIFLKQLKELSGDESSGDYFPPIMKSKIVEDFTDGVIKAIHRIFFSNKNILLREHRLAFIEIYHTFLILKFLDITKPNSFSLTCKDGVDTAACSNALLFLFLKLLGKESFGQEAWTEFNRLLYTPAILVRERLPLKDRFERMKEAFKVIALVHDELGDELFSKVIHEAFGHFYESPIFDGMFVRVEAI